MLSAFLRFFLCFYYAEAGMPRSRAAQCAAGPRPAPFHCPPYRCRAWTPTKKVDKYAIIKDTKRRSKNVNKEESQIHQRIQTNHRLPEIRTMLISAAVLLLRAAGLFFHLCVILDLFSRKVIAYKLFGSSRYSEIQKFRRTR